MRQAGLTYDEGPTSAANMVRISRLSASDLYSQVRLGAGRKGGAYCCFCTKEELEADRRTAKLGAKPISITKCLHQRQP